MTDGMEIEVKHVDDLRPYHRNPQEHPDDQIEELKSSIRKFGFQVPVIVDEDGTIISGHARFKAVQELRGDLSDEISDAKLSDNDTLVQNLQRVNDGELFVRVEDELSEDEKQEFRISDNKVSELSEWENEKLKFELRELEQAVGYSDEELDAMLETDVDYDDLEDDIVEETMDDIEDDLEDKGSEEDTQMVDLICPECHEGFQLEADELVRKLEREFGKDL